MSGLVLRFTRTERAAHRLATGGHLYMAIVNAGTRPALRGMLTGKVDREWARTHHADWRSGGEADASEDRAP